MNGESNAKEECETYATVWTRPSTLARAKYDPEDPLVIILG